MMSSPTSLTTNFVIQKPGCFWFTFPTWQKTFIALSGESVDFVRQTCVLIKFKVDYAKTLLKLCCLKKILSWNACEKLNTLGGEENRLIKSLWSSLASKCLEAWSQITHDVLKG